MVAIILDLLIGYGRWVQHARGSRGSRAPAQAAGAQAHTLRRSSLAWCIWQLKHFQRDSRGTDYIERKNPPQALTKVESRRGQGMNQYRQPTWRHIGLVPYKTGGK